MALFSRRGEYVLLENEPARAVESRLRPASAAFSSSSGSSRFDVFDADRRYEVELRAGVVWWRVGDRDYAPLRIAELPWGLSYQQKRDGEELKEPALDMIVASRGRLLAKEQGTGRVFHLLVDHLFRARRVRWRDENGTTDTATRWLDELAPAPDGTGPAATVDPPVPSNYLKLDPEFFTPGSGFRVPWPLRLDYTQHPASVRFPLFERLLAAETGDLMGVPVIPRIWYLIDARSPLQVFDLRDVECIGDDELLDVVTRKRIEAVLLSALRDVILPDVIDDLRQSIAELVDQLPGASVAAGTAVREALASIERARETARGQAAAIPVPGARSFAEAILDQLRILGEVATEVPALVADRIRAVLEAQLVKLAAEVAARVGGLFLRLWIERFKLGGLVLPALVGGGVFVLRLQQEGILEFEESPTSGCSPRTVLKVDVDGLARLGGDNDVQPLRRLLDRLLQAGRERRGVTIPNDVPAVLPSYDEVTYSRLGLPLVDDQRRKAIDFVAVLDLGIGSGHWAEHWIASYGGEIHSVLHRRPIFQGEQFSAALYRFLNGPIDDGDSFIDGTTNFYMLVKLNVPDDSTGRKFAVVWLDEQTYFTQRWRLLHPTLDCDGDLVSLTRQLRFNPEYFRFDLARFWDPFEHDCIDERSRMCVARQIVAVSGRDPQLDRAEIYTCCFAFGICDRTWRWRGLPAVAAEYLDEPVVASNQGLPPRDTSVVYANTLGLREDTTLHLRGFHPAAAGGAPVEGRWVQRYLPCDARHVPEGHQLAADQRPAVGFSHPWDFVSEDAFRRADRFYQLGIFAPAPSDSRSQYYEVELRTDLDGEDPSRVVWINRQSDDVVNPNLRSDTVTFNWSALALDRPLSAADVLDDRTQARAFSLHESATRLRLLERPPLGTIAVFLDKRDDDLQAASHLPHDTVLIEDTSSAAVRLAASNGPFCAGLVAPVEGADPRQVHVLVRSHRKVTRAPTVYQARVSRTPGVPRGFTLQFWTPLSVDEVHRALWRCSLAALDDDGSVVDLLAVEVFGSFRRQGIPRAPLPSGFTAADVLQPAYEYRYEWAAPLELAGPMNRLCTPEGRVRWFTSVWFEDVVGHRSTPDVLELRV